MFEKFSVAAQCTFVDFLSGSVKAQLSDLAPARTVPALQIDGQTVVTDSLAIAEELATRHPEISYWPKDPDARAVARGLTCEMHAGFQDLRNHCPMNLRTAYTQCSLPDGVYEDVARLEEIWGAARHRFADAGPWLCGAYSVADVFYAPVAARLAGYDLPMSDLAGSYVQQHLADPAFRRWRAVGMSKDAELPWYRKEFAHRDWPLTPRIHALAVDAAESENQRCPYSGKEVRYFGQFEGRVFGFCNALCRDKTVFDPEVWPEFMAFYEL